MTTRRSRTFDEEVSTFRHDGSERVFSNTVVFCDVAVRAVGYRERSCVRVCKSKENVEVEMCDIKTKA